MEISLCIYSVEDKFEIEVLRTCTPLKTDNV